MTIDDVINAKKLDFITKVYRQDEYTRLGGHWPSSTDPPTGSRSIVPKWPKTVIGRE